MCWETYAEENPGTEMWNDRWVALQVGGPRAVFWNSFLVGYVFPGPLVSTLIKQRHLPKTSLGIFSYCLYLWARVFPVGFQAFLVAPGTSLNGFPGSSQNGPIRKEGIIFYLVPAGLTSDPCITAQQTLVVLLVLITAMRLKMASKGI